MKAFHFTLQQILDYRIAQRDIAQNDLGKAVQAEKVIIDTAQSITNRCKVLEQSLLNSKDFIALTRATDYYTYARGRLDALSKELQEAKIVTSKKRDALKTAMQRVSQLEKVRDTQYAAYKVAVAHEEDITLDDLISSRTSRSPSA